MRHRGQVQNLVAATITHLQSRVTRSASSSKRFRDLDATPREVCSFHPPETVRFTPGVDTYPAHGRGTRFAVVALEFAHCGTPTVQFGISEPSSGISAHQTVVVVVSRLMQS